MWNFINMPVQSFVDILRLPCGNLFIVKVCVVLWHERLSQINPLSANFTKWSHSIRRQIVDELFECVWPFCLTISLNWLIPQRHVTMIPSLEIANSFFPTFPKWHTLIPRWSRWSWWHYCLPGQWSSVHTASILRKSLWEQCRSAPIFSSREGLL